MEKLCFFQDGWKAFAGNRNDIGYGLNERINDMMPMQHAVKGMRPSETARHARVQASHNRQGALDKWLRALLMNAETTKQFQVGAKGQTEDRLFPGHALIFILRYKIMNEEEYALRMKTAIDALNISDVKRLKQIVMEANRIYTIGNGGSMALAMHLAEDLMKMKNKKTQCISDPSLISMAGNDEGYENIFSWPLQRLASSSDLVIALSVSGRSPNIINVVENESLKCRKFLITGTSGRLAKCEKLVVSSDDYQICEDVFSVICHMLCK